MKYTTLGQTNIKVSKVCLGCMSFGKAGTMHDWTLDEKQTEEMYVPHPIVDAINENPPQGTVLLDKNKKEFYDSFFSFVNRINNIVPTHVEQTIKLT